MRAFVHSSCQQDEWLPVLEEWGCPVGAVAQYEVQCAKHNVPFNVQCSLFVRVGRCRLFGRVTESHKSQAVAPVERAEHSIIADNLTPSLLCAVPLRRQSFRVLKSVVNELDATSRHYYFIGENYRIFVRPTAFNLSLRDDLFFVFWNSRNSIIRRQV